MVVRDEVDIVAANLDHHLYQGVAHILVTDNGSVDGTRDVLDWYERNHPVTVYDQPAGEFLQGEWVTGMTQLAAPDFGAEWIVHLDADEFLIDGDGPLDERLAAIDHCADAVVVPRHDHVLIEDRIGDVAPLLQTVRKSVSRNIFGGPLAPKIVHRADPAVRVLDGSHAVVCSRIRRRGELPALRYHHYPVRSYAQAQRKVTAIAEGRMAAGLDRIGMSSVSMARHRMIAEGTFEAEFRRNLAPEPEALEQGLADGTYIVDTSMSEAIMAARHCPPMDAAGPSASAPTLERDARRQGTVLHMRTREMLRSVRQSMTGPMVVVGGIEIAQLYDEPWRRGFGTVDLIVTNLDSAINELANVGYEVGLCAPSDSHDLRAAVCERADTDLAMVLCEAAPGARWRNCSIDEVVGQARPSRTALDGVMRPRDDHHLDLLAARAESSNHANDDRVALERVPAVC